MAEAKRFDCSCKSTRADAYPWEPVRKDGAYPWDQCMADAMKEYGDEDTAKKVCGKIKAENG